MSAREKILAITVALLIFMSLALNSTVKQGEIQKSTSNPEIWSIILSLAVILSTIIVILIFLSWRDIKLKRKDLYRDGLFTKAVSGLLILLLLSAAVYLIEGGGRTTLMPNLTENGIINASGPIGTPQSYNVSPNKAVETGRTLGNTVWIGYTLGIVFVISLVVVGILYYRDMLKRKRREAIRKKAEAFDRKLDETGLEGFENPREAVVGIYKNAVLWLEYLGMPYKESWTHWEHAEHVRFRRKAFLELTRLFEKSKYAPERVTWNDARAALQAYNDLRRGMNENP